MLRRVLVQFVGDVAAYVSPYEVNRFQDVRNAIQQRGRTVARLVYGAGYGEDGGPADRYDEVLVVGSTAGAVSRVFLGSRATKIVRHSPVPVIAVPAAVARS